MAGERYLKNIAHGLLGTFVSRNNDIEGYWGLGILRAFAVNNELSKIVIDLLGASPNFSDQSPVKVVELKYQEWLLSMFQRLGVDKHQINHAEIQIEFSTFDQHPSAIRDTRGEPYVCTALISNQSGKSYVASKIGVCAPHDPSKDIRSVRADEA